MKKKLTTMVLAFAAQFMAVCVFAETIDLWSLKDETVKILNNGDVATGKLLSTTHGSAVVSIAPGATVTLDGVDINGDGDMAQGNAGITCLGNATIILKGNNVVRGLDPNYPGIFVPPGKTLTIRGGGRLEAYGSDGAGIGGGYSFVPYTDDRSCGNVVIEGGTVIAESRVAAGIGSGHSGTLNGGGSCGDIVINGGTVNATGAAAGIGGASGGDTSRCGDITINGGNVTATCTGVDGPGIGACSSGRCGAITINGGSVTANARAKEDQGSEKGSCAAGIGTGAYGRCGVITINGGSVVANGGCCYPYTRLLFGSGYDPEGVASGAGIGSGFSGNCEGVIVNGGNVEAHGGCGITDPSYKISVFGDYVDGGGAAGIGAGGFFRIHGNAARSSACGDIVISGGSIISEGGVLAAGIGAGYDANCGDIFLRGATVYAAGHSGPGIGVGLTSKCGRIAFRSGKPLYVRSVVLDREYSFAVGGTIARSSYEGITLEDGLVDNATWGEKVIRERMIFWNGDLNFINEDSTLIDGSFATGLACGNWKLSIADGATVTISNVTINGSNNLDYKWAGITCEGNATIILKGDNVVKGWYKDYPGIYVPPGKKLTIQGDGSLTASSSGRGAGIGGGYEIACGHIDIEGGSVTATGGDYAAGIGSGYNADCGNILIKPGITHVTATYGANGVKPIGNGAGGEPAGYNATGLSVKTVGATCYISPGAISGPDEISGAGETVLQNGDILTGEITGKRKMSIAAGATVTISDITLDGLTEGGYANTDWAGITCLGNATIILEGGNYVAGYNQYRPGIHVPVGSTLTIKGGGSLIADGAERAAGIGGAWKLACGNIVIESGHVEAHGGSDAAGIGGGFMGACGDIAIEGGYVWATGGNDAAGIGSGSFSSCGDITITGGEVAASGNGYAAGIGGGNGGEIGSIYIGEGIVRVAATRGGSTGRDPIGGGNGTVTISESLGDTLMDDGATRIIAPLVTVTFDANGGTVSPATRKVVKGGSIGELPVPVKSGYEFNGWYFNPLFNFYAATSTDLASGSLTLYAKWTELPIPTLDPNVFCVKTLAELGYAAPSEGGPYTFSVKGLPAGLKFTAKDLAATTKQPAVAANSVYGTPTKPGIYEMTVTAKSKTNTKGVTASVVVVVANLVDSEIPVAGSYGPFIPGVEYIEPIAAAEGCSVSGLPSGMKWTAKDIVDSKTKTLKVPANSAYGGATKPGNYTVTFTKTVNKVKHTATAVFKVLALPVLTVETTGNGTGKVTGAGAFPANKVVTLKATADTKDAAASGTKPATKKSVFMGWYIGDTLISQAASYKYTMPEYSTMLKAKFITVAEEAAALSAMVGGTYEFVASAPTSKNATVYAGVYVEWPVEIDGATPTTVAVSGLPAGLKFTAKDIMKKGSKTEVEVPANTIYGAPTAASKIDSKTSQPKPSKVKITLTTAGKSKYVFDLNLTVEPMEEWAVGTFEGVGLDDDHKGIGGDSKGRYLHATFTVAANGKISGKVTTLAGETWTLSAPYFDWFSIYSPLEYRATLFDKSGNPFTLQLQPRYGIDSYGFMNVWFGTNGWIDPTQANWNKDLWKSAAKPLAKVAPLVIPTTDIDGNPGELTLKFASSGKVTYTAKFANYSASGSSSLEHDSDLGSGGAFDAKLTVLLPAKAGKFPGCIKHLLLKWDGTQFTNVYEM